VFLLVPPFSDEWLSADLLAILVFSTGMTISSVSFWPFPEFWNCFMISFNDNRKCDSYFVVVRFKIVLAELSSAGQFLKGVRL
jgi:hypothetical protein